jgi:hypothetical protein
MFDDLNFLEVALSNDFARVDMSDRGWIVGSSTNNRGYKWKLDHGIERIVN